MGLFLEDFSLGQRFGSPALLFDAAVGGGFEFEFGAGLGVMAVASLTMRLLVESAFAPEGGILGAGVEALEWPEVAVAGDVLRIESEVLEVRRSQRRPERGLLRVRTTTLAEDGRVVQAMVSTVVVVARG